MYVLFMTSPVDLALRGLSSALDVLVASVDSGGLDQVDDVGLVRFLQGFEQVRNRMSLVDHRVITEGEARRLPESLTQTSMARVLTQALRIPAAEAGRRVRAAEALAERVTMHGEALGPRRPMLSASQRAGLVTPEQVNIVVSALARVDRPGFDPADIEAGERLLTDFAHTFGPPDLRVMADTVVDRIDPDGSPPPGGTELGPAVRGSAADRGWGLARGVSADRTCGGEAVGGSGAVGETPGQHGGDRVGPVGRATR